MAAMAMCGDCIWWNDSLSLLISNGKEKQREPNKPLKSINIAKSIKLKTFNSKILMR